MKKLIILLAVLAMCGCKERDDHIIKVREAYDLFAVPAELRDIGYDSLQFLVSPFSKRRWVNFCYPNNLRYKKDTVYTWDTAYKLWGFKVKIAPGIFITKRHGESMTMTGGHFMETGCDSVIIDSFKIIVRKVNKP